MDLIQVFVRPPDKPCFSVFIKPHDIVKHFKSLVQKKTRILVKDQELELDDDGKFNFLRNLCTSTFLC
jgi:hypothetical protein